jgi:AbrB family looped-hinge helix DNA binding protein
MDVQLTRRRSGITFLKQVIPEAGMATTVTSKGQVTLPKKIREAAGIRPGDKVDVRATASGGVYIEKPGAATAYRKKLEALADRRLIRGATTDEIMLELRGNPAEDPTQ